MRSSAVPHLVRFPPESENADDARDLALAWGSLAQSGTGAAAYEAERFLKKALAEKPDDPQLLSALGYIAQRKGAIQQARDFYQRALHIDPTLNDAATNLGVIEAREGHLQQAVHLWRDAFLRAPGRSAIGMNLAHVYCNAGQFEEARKYTARVLEFNPDLPEAKALLRQLNTDAPHCDVR
jgi:Flp pilus assembly protein TadD